jgi:hypothetical protein
MMAKNEEAADIEMLRKQNSITGPHPLALLDRAGGNWPALFRFFEKMDKEQGERITRTWVFESTANPQDGAFVECTG